MKPAVIIKNVKNYSIDSINLFIEASLYSGIKTVIFTRSAENDILAQILKTAKSKGSQYAQIGSHIQHETLGIGYRGISENTVTGNYGAIQNSEYKKYRKTFTAEITKRQRYIFQDGTGHLTV